MPRLSRERKKPELYVAEPASTADGQGKAKNRGRGRAASQGRGNSKAEHAQKTSAEDDSNTEPSNPPQPQAVGNKQDLIGKRLTVRWEKEEEDFEGYVRDFQPGGDFPYEVAYDDGDEEWGYFSATHFHTDEVNRKYTWLPEQDEAVAKAAASVWQEQVDKRDSKNEPASAPAASEHAQLSGVNSLAAQKGLLRANRAKVQQQAATTEVQQSHGSKAPTAPHGSKQTDTPAPQTAPASSLTSLTDSAAAAVAAQPVAPIPVTSAAASAAAVDTADSPTIAPNKRRRLEPILSQAAVLPADNSHLSAQTPSGAAASSNPVHFSSSVQAGQDQAINATGSQLDASLRTSQAANASPPAASLPDKAAQPSPATIVSRDAAPAQRCKRLSKSPQPDSQIIEPEQSMAKDTKRRRLRKASDVSVPGAACDGLDAVAKQENDLNGSNEGQQTHQEQLPRGSAVQQGHKSPAKALSRAKLQQQSASANQPPAAAAAQPPSQGGQTPQAASLPIKREAVPQLIPQSDLDPIPAQSTPAFTAIKAELGAASLQSDLVKLEPATANGTAGKLPSMTAKAAAQKQAAAQLLNGSPRTSTPASQPSPAARPGLLQQAFQLPPSAHTSSTRIAMPRSLTSLSSLRPADPLPKAEPTSTSSPAPASDAQMSSSSAAEAAAGEAQLQATAQQFELLLHNTLQRTKEGVHKVREYVLRAAGGPQGKQAARRLIIMVLDLIETAQMHKRIDLFYLMDSLLQASQRDSKAGIEGRAEAMKLITKVVAAGLHRIAQAMGQDSECISKASKVFEIWQRRQILKASVVAPALQLLAKLKAEHDQAQAASLAELTRLGQTSQGRRPMRVNLPCAPPGSISGLPTHVMHLTLDQWACLSGFRYQRPDGQQTEFRLKPEWRLPQQAEVQDWDVNPASGKLSQAEVLADAALIREQHLQELELQKEAKEARERSPWGQHNVMQEEQGSDFASPVLPDIDMEEGQSPDEDAAGYVSTGAHTAFKFEPPRAPAHYGASRNSPSEDPYAGYQSQWGFPAAPSQPWPGADAGAWGYSMGQLPLQHSHSMYDPFSSQASQSSLHSSRAQHLMTEHMQSASHSQSPDDQGTWYDVPFDEGSHQLPTAGQEHKAAEPARVKGWTEQAVQGPVAVRDSTTDFDADTAWSDDEGPPPLPAEPAPPLPESLPPLPSEPPPAPLPPLPMDEDQPPLPPDEASEARLATAGLFEPASHAAPSAQPPPLPSPGMGLNYGYQ